MKRWNEIHCMTLLSAWLNILMNELIVFSPGGFLKLRAYWKKKWRKKVLLWMQLPPHGWWKQTLTKVTLTERCGSALAWVQPVCVLRLSDLQFWDHPAAYSSREICYIQSHQRTSCFWIPLRAFKRLTSSVIGTLLSSLSLRPLSFSSFLKGKIRKWREGEYKGGR